MHSFRDPQGCAAAGLDRPTSCTQQWRTCPQLPPKLPTRCPQIYPQPDRAITAYPQALGTTCENLGDRLWINTPQLWTTRLVDKLVHSAACSSPSCPQGSPQRGSATQQRKTGLSPISTGPTTPALFGFSLKERGNEVGRRVKINFSAAPDSTSRETPDPRHGRRAHALPWETHRAESRRGSAALGGGSKHDSPYPLRFAVHSTPASRSTRLSTTETSWNRNRKDTHEDPSGT
ncbi:hypothetical protein SAMN04487820_10615 [Actinopolyspora mzabensis]|uniref:Uncharacterized protein n=1 Tax=Actinopolyspora mzabensis TaxID=995066 RepID=A0A1G9AFL2_ACTMZ|nr:hypothetical protein SAMN04487820_10615 [Actinopolyspora mzabensis]